MGARRWIGRALRLAGRSPGRMVGAVAGDLLWLKTAGIGTVIDVGANVGQFAKRALSVLPDACVYAFEPVESSYKALVASLGQNERFTAFNCALGDVEGTSDFYVSEFTPASSMLKIGAASEALFPATSAMTRTQVVTRRLDALEGDIAVEGRLLIKMDVQGFEDRVVRGGTRMFMAAHAVIAEVCFMPLYKGQAVFEDLGALLSDLDYRYAGTLAQHDRPTDGLPVFADVVFLKRDVFYELGLSK